MQPWESTHAMRLQHNSVFVCVFKSREVVYVHLQAIVTLLVEVGKFLCIDIHKAQSRGFSKPRLAEAE